jgi:hypothetical protein
MGKGAQLFLKRWVGLTRNGDDRKTQEGRSPGGTAVGVAKKEVKVESSNPQIFLLTSPMT